MMNSTIVRIFDTTLHEGEQLPGAAMTTEEKLDVVEQLIRLNVNIAEVGFPAASPDDLATVKEIARHTYGIGIAGRAYTRISDINAAWEGICEAEQPILHVFLEASEHYCEHKLKLDPGEVIERIRSVVAYARNLCPGVQFSIEDATRSSWDYLCRLVEAAIKSGATIINIPDTAGYTLPHEYKALFLYLREHVPGIEDVIMSAHCHNNLGLATANTLAAIQAGARQVEVTINGLGERAGNTAMEEVVMALRTRSECFNNVDTQIRAEELLAASQLVSQLTNIPVLPNKVFVEANVFAYEVDDCQMNMLRDCWPAEMMGSRSVVRAGSVPAMDNHSGRYGFDARLRRLGYRLSAQQLRVAYGRFTALVDQNKHITDADLIYIVDITTKTPAAI